ncbi:hypothetical protein B0J14DRAFT_555839 [Halenospora varia]|nr:hypothetical protein B0J14DRAFT_555839 [Halenospora varia]
MLTTIIKPFSYYVGGKVNEFGIEITDEVKEAIENELKGSSNKGRPFHYAITALNAKGPRKFQKCNYIARDTPSTQGRKQSAGTIQKRLARCQTKWRKVRHATWLNASGILMIEGMKPSQKTMKKVLDHMLDAINADYEKDAQKISPGHRIKKFVQMGHYTLIEEDDEEDEEGSHQEVEDDLEGDTGIMDAETLEYLVDEDIDPNHDCIWNSKTQRWELLEDLSNNQAESSTANGNNNYANLDNGPEEGEGSGTKEQADEEADDDSARFKFEY